LLSAGYLTDLVLKNLTFLKLTQLFIKNILLSNRAEQDLSYVFRHKAQGVQMFFIAHSHAFFQNPPPKADT